MFDFLKKEPPSQNHREPLQAQDVDKAFKLKENTTTTSANLIGSLRSPEGRVLPQIEVMKIDTRENKSDISVPYIINITGVWGRGPECEAEAIAFALAMGAKGMQADFVSIPGHGETSNSIEGWDQPGDFEASARMLMEYIRQVKIDNHERKIVIHAWSMGGMTALKALALMPPNFVDGLVLVDTPVKPGNFAKTALRFFAYAGQKVTKESRLQLQTKLKGLSIFIDRLRERNAKTGMPLREVVLRSARSLMSQDLFQDGTLEKVAQKAIHKEAQEGTSEETQKGTPILLLHGSNDFVIPVEQLNEFVKFLHDRGVQIQDTIVEGSGHALIDEQPKKVASILREWMQENGLLEDTSPAYPEELADTEYTDRLDTP